jgi:putative FmdB family regulatory protein
MASETREARMPILEIAGHDCGRDFEALVRSSTVPTCPACASTHLEKKLSVFAAGAAEAESMPAMGPCGSCGHPDGPGARTLH